MIKKILVALDQDTDTPIATQYAIQIAKHTKAGLTGLAIVDTNEIAASSKGGGIGSFFYAEKLRESLTSETRAQARKLINAFEKRIEKEGLQHIEIVEEGVSSQRIVEDMKYHDLLILGSDPHFFYGHPNQHTKTLAGIFHHTTGPTLIVPNRFVEVKKALFAYDGSNNAARTLHHFVQLAPFGPDVEISVVFIKEKGGKDADLHLELMKSYLDAHGFASKMTLLEDKKVEPALLQQAELMNADLIISGGTAHSSFTGIKFGETTSYLIENSTVPLFMDH